VDLLIGSDGSGAYRIVFLSLTLAAGRTGRFYQTRVPIAAVVDLETHKGRHTVSQKWNSITFCLGKHGSLQSYSIVCRMQLVDTYARRTRMLEINYCGFYLILYYNVYRVMQKTLTKCALYAMIVCVLHSLCCNMLTVTTRVQIGESDAKNNK